MAIEQGSLQMQYTTNPSGLIIVQAAPLVAAGFGRPDDDHNRTDTEAHLGEADIVQYVLDEEGRLIAFAAFKDIGNRAVELSGIVTNPSKQRKGIGLRMVQDFVGTQQPQDLVAYTRNPAILRIMNEVGGVDNVLTSTDAAVVPEAEISDDGIPYHFGRYVGGLYGNYDPATREYIGRTLIEQAVALVDPRNALAVAVKVPYNERGTS
ncbi:GNAT family N-acetyltransferase [Candidatus Saccharibacteria bacterium]|nr:GNAT family N-acetyltransferase [Candidatus Saccharibacteria bacterium]